MATKTTYRYEIIMGSRRGPRGAVPRLYRTRDEAVMAVRDGETRGQAHYIRRIALPIEAA